MIDTFNGCDDKLLMSIRSLLDLDARGALSSGIGGHARTLLESSAARLAARDARIVELEAVMRDMVGWLNHADDWPGLELEQRIRAAVPEDPSHG